MRRLMLGAATAAIALVAGCSVLGKQAFQQPIVHLQDVRINGVGLSGGNLDVKLSVYNPNGYRLEFATQNAAEHAVFRSNREAAHEQLRAWSKPTA